VRTPSGPLGRRQRKTVLGIDIGTHAIRVVQVGPYRGRPAVYNFARASTPPGAFREHEPVDVEALGEVLKDLLAERNIRRPRCVVTGVNSRRAVLRRAVFPRMSDEEFRQALKWEAENYLPIPVEEAVIDFQRLPEERDRSTPGPGRMQVLLVASYRELVERYRALCAAAGLELDIVEVDCLAQWRALAALNLVDARAQLTTLVVDMGEEATRIALYRRGVFVTLRHLPLGGAYLTRALQDRLGVSFGTAEELKGTHGLISEKRADVAEVLTDALERVYEELLRLIRQLLLREGRADPVALFFIGGGAAGLQGFSEFVTHRHRMLAEVDIPPEAVQVVDLAAAAALAPWMERNREFFTGEYTTALGMALRSPG